MLIFFDRWYKGKDVVYRSSLNTEHVVSMSPMDVESPEDGTRIILDPAYNDGHKHIVYTRMTVPELEATIGQAMEQALVSARGSKPVATKQPPARRPRAKRRKD